jgi:hypothetical protein
MNKGVRSMATTEAEVTKEKYQNTMRNILALSNEFFLKLAKYTEELIEEQEEAEDIAYIDSLTPEDYANAVTLEEITAKYNSVK